LPGSDLAKERLKVVLETLAGSCRVQEACQRLQISEPRFHQLRLQVLESALGSLEPRSPGRPPKCVTPAEEQVAQLQEQLTEKEIELRAAQARAEIALVLPHVVQDDPTSDATAPSPASGPEKKTPKHRRPTPGKRKST
jgi:hypothetical protein